MPPCRAACLQSSTVFTGIKLRTLCKVSQPEFTHPSNDGLVSRSATVYYGVNWGKESGKPDTERNVCGGSCIYKGAVAINNGEITLDLCGTGNRVRKQNGGEGGYGSSTKELDHIEGIYCACFFGVDYELVVW